MPKDRFASPGDVKGLAARDIMTSAPVTVEPDTLLSKVMELVEQRKIQHFPVLDGERYVGMLGEHDLHDFMPSVLTFGDPEARKRHLRATRVSQVITKDPPKVSPDAPLVQVIDIMRTHRLGALAVVASSRLKGIITAGDLISLLDRVLRSAERWPLPPA